jgi:hypothetical protein
VPSRATRSWQDCCPTSLPDSQSGPVASKTLVPKLPSKLPSAVACLVFLRWPSSPLVKPLASVPLPPPRTPPSCRATVPIESLWCWALALAVSTATIDFTKSIVDGGMAAASPAVFPYTVMNASAGLLAIELGLLGPNVTINHRELSLPEAIATGAELLATGRADAVLCGGCDELSPWLVHGLWRLSALSPQIAVASEPPLSSLPAPQPRHRSR